MAFLPFYVYVHFISLKIPVTLILIFLSDFYAQYRMLFVKCEISVLSM